MLRVVVYFTWAYSICEVSATLKKILFNSKDQKEFKYESACNYIKCWALQHLRVTKLKLSLIHEV